MTKREKRLRKLRQSPKNASFAELRQVLEDYDFVLVRTTGSHFIFKVKEDEVEWELVIPFANPVKVIYVKRALVLIDEIRAKKVEVDDDDESSDED
jgi:predicted RNA binding protein YcfA (HicA-like mRNA interferase family)